MRGAKEINATMPMLPNELLLNNDLFFIEVTRMLSQGRSVTLRAKGKSILEEKIFSTSNGIWRIIYIETL